MIKVIETHYKGYRFRSRLEARWAVFFDEAGIEYQYEPEGFEYFAGNGKTFRYLPDFYLPRSETWVEVKGTDEAWQDALGRGLTEILDYASPLPGMCGSYDSLRGLLVLGEIPYVTWGVVAHPIIQHDKGLHQKWAMFTHEGLYVARHGDVLAWALGIDAAGDASPTNWTTKAIFQPTPYAHKRTIEAYNKARAARFEYGECPA